MGADKACDTAEFAGTCKAFGAEAHAARNTAGRRSNIGEEMAASEGYRASQVPDGTPAIFHGSRCLARYRAAGEPIDTPTRQAA